MSRDEAGFTLVEVLAAIALLSLATLGVAATLGTGGRVARGAGDRIAGSAAARQLVVRLPPDVHVAVDAVASPTGEGITCAGVEAPRLRLLNTDGTETVYGVARHAGGWVLERHHCDDGTSTEAVVVSRQLTGPDGVVPARQPATGPFTGASITVVTAESEGPPRPVTVSGTRRTT